MAKECFCGCGLEVPFGRRRAANAVGAQFDELLRVLHGAVSSTATASRSASRISMTTARPRRADSTSWPSSPELRSSGVLTEAEFEAEKRRILAGE